MEKNAKNLEWGVHIKNSNHLLDILNFYFSFTYIVALSLFINNAVPQILC